MKGSFDAQLKRRNMWHTLGKPGAPASQSIAERFMMTLKRKLNCYWRAAGVVSYFSRHTAQASSFGGCMAQASYFDTARRLASVLAQKARFVTTSKVRSCHKADFLVLVVLVYDTI